MRTKTVYHVSPENFSVFTPKYHKAFGKSGVFFSQKFSSTVSDWALGYVFWKKSRKANKKDLNYTVPHKHYKYVWIYFCEIPDDIYQELVQEFLEAAQKETDQSRFFSFWFWGEQFFLPEKYLKEVKIVKKKRYKFYPLMSISERISRKPFSKGYEKKLRSL